MGRDLQPINTRTSKDVAREAVSDEALGPWGRPEDVADEDEPADEVVVEEDDTVASALATEVRRRCPEAPDPMRRLARETSRDREPTASRERRDWRLPAPRVGDRSSWPSRASSREDDCPADTPLDEVPDDTAITDDD